MTYCAFSLPRNPSSISALGRRCAASIAAISSGNVRTRETSAPVTTCIAAPLCVRRDLYGVGTDIAVRQRGGGDHCKQYVAEPHQRGKQNERAEAEENVHSAV